jgi:hypothetical protein
MRRNDERICGEGEEEMWMRENRVEGRNIDYWGTKY